MNMEIIVSDNCSTDKTREIIQTFSDPRLKIVTWDTLLSAANHWTEICKLSTGHYTKIICADDIVYPQGVVSQLNMALRHPHIGLISSPRDVITNKGHSVFRSHGTQYADKEEVGLKSLERSIRSGTNAFGEPFCVLFKTQNLKDSLPWSDQFPYVIDLDMYSRVLSHTSYICNQEPIGAFRLSRTSWSSKIGSKQSQNFIDWLDLLLKGTPISFSKSELKSIHRKTIWKSHIRRFINWTLKYF